MAIAALAVHIGPLQTGSVMSDSVQLLDAATDEPASSDLADPSARSCDTSIQLERLEFGPDPAQVLGYGGSCLYVSRDGGSNFAPTYCDPALDDFDWTYTTPGAAIFLDSGELVFGFDSLGRPPNEAIPLTFVDAAGVRRTVVSPVTDNILVMEHNDERLFLATPTTVYSTSDAGQTWSEHAFPNPDAEWYDEPRVWGGEARLNVTDDGNLQVFTGFQDCRHYLGNVFSGPATDDELAPVEIEIPSCGHDTQWHFDQAGWTYGFYMWQPRFCTWSEATGWQEDAVETVGSERPSGLNVWSSGSRVIAAVNGALVEFVDGQMRSLGIPAGDDLENVFVSPDGTIHASITGIPARWNGTNWLPWQTCMATPGVASPDHD